MPADLEVPVLIAVFVAVMTAAAYLLAVVSGWRTLARRFPPLAQGEGQRYRFASAKMGRVPWFPVNFGASLIVTVGPTGISMATYFPFRLFCAPFFVPWSQVESVEEKSTPLSRRTMVRFRDSLVRLAFRGAVAQTVVLMHARMREGQGAAAG